MKNGSGLKDSKCLDWGNNKNLADSGRGRCGGAKAGYQELNFRHMKCKALIKFLIRSAEWIVAYSSLHSGKLFRLEV